MYINNRAFILLLFLCSGCVTVDLGSRHEYLAKREISYEIGKSRYVRNNDHKIFIDIRSKFCVQRPDDCNEISEKSIINHYLFNDGYGLNYMLTWRHPECPQQIEGCHRRRIDFSVEILSCSAKYDCSYRFKPKVKFVKDEPAIKYRAPLFEHIESSSEAFLKDIRKKICADPAVAEYCYENEDKKMIQFTVNKFECCPWNLFDYDPNYGLRDYSSDQSTIDAPQYHIHIGWSFPSKREANRMYRSAVAYAVKPYHCESDSNCQYLIQKLNYMEICF